MLKQRVITALVLMALLFPALVINPIWPFACLTLLGFAVAGWEWARLNNAGPVAIVLGTVFGAVCAATLATGWSDRAPAALWWLASTVWVLGGAWLLRGGPSVWPKSPPAFRCGLGLLALYVAWLALVNAKALGLNFILSVFSLVWAADIAAYFGGRAFGRRKLALAISPGKSWEGVWSGMLGAVLVAGLWLWVDGAFAVDAPSVYSRLATRLGLPWMLLAVIFMVAMSVVGDLIESLVKRSAGAKDSSTLLPGHGGVLDRVDGLLPVFPIALALIGL